MTSSIPKAETFSAYTDMVTKLDKVPDQVETFGHFAHMVEKLDNTDVKPVLDRLVISVEHKNSFKARVYTVAQKVATFVKDVFKAIGDTVSRMIQSIREAGTSLSNRVKNLFKKDSSFAALRSMADAVEAVEEAKKDQVADIFSSFAPMVEAVETATSEPVVAHEFDLTDKHVVGFGSLGGAASGVALANYLVPLSLATAGFAVSAAAVGAVAFGLAARDVVNYLKA